jgi:hypothetical protein
MGLAIGFKSLTKQGSCIYFLEGMEGDIPKNEVWI